MESESAILCIIFHRNQRTEKKYIFRSSFVVSNSAECEMCTYRIDLTEVT